MWIASVGGSLRLRRAELRAARLVRQKNASDERGSARAEGGYGSHYLAHPQRLILARVAPPAMRRADPRLSHYLAHPQRLVLALVTPPAIRRAAAEVRLQLGPAPGQFGAAAQETFKLSLHCGRFVDGTLRLDSTRY